MAKAAGLDATVCMVLANEAKHIVQSPKGYSNLSNIVSCFGRKEGESARVSADVVS